MSAWLRRLRPSEADLETALRWAWLALPLAALIVWFGPGLISGKGAYWGTVLFQFYGWRSLALEQVRAGLLPLWNPLVGGGAPLLANYQTGILYPPNWLHLILPVEIAIVVLAALHLLWAAAGMRFYLKRLGVDALGQAVGALAYGLSGYLVSRQIFPSIGVVAPWLPWLLWAIDGLLAQSAGGTPRRAGLLALVAALILLGGHAQTAYYCLLYGGLYGLWRLWQRPGTLREKAVLAAFAALAGLVGVALALAQLAPTYELLSLSQRSGGAERAFVMTYSFWPPHFATLISPNLFGSPARGDYWGVRPYWEDAVYVGVLTLALNLRAIWRWAEGLRAGRAEALYRPVPFILAGLPLIWLLALGNNTPVFPWLYDHVPTFDAFQAPARWLLLAVFGMAALGGIGAQGWASRPRAQAAAGRALTAGLAILLASGAIGLLLWESLRPSMVFGMARVGLMLGALGVVTLGLRASERGRLPRSAWAMAVLIFLMLDLGTAHSGLLPLISREVYAGQGDLAGVLGLGAGERVLISPKGEAELQIDYSITFEDFQANDPDHWLEVRGTMLPNTTMIDGVASFSNFDPLRPDWYVEAMNALDRLPVEAAAARAAEWHVSVYLSMVGCGALEEVAASGPVSACAVPGPLPRLFTADCGNDSNCLPRPGEQVMIQSEGPDGALDLRVRAEVPGTLVLLDTWYPGWRALVNGEDVEVERVNGLFRGIAIPAGESQVQISYQPASVRIGLLGSLLGGLACIVLLGWPSRADRQVDDPSERGYIVAS